MAPATALQASQQAPRVVAAKCHGGLSVGGSNSAMAASVWGPGAIVWGQVRAPTKDTKKGTVIWQVKW